MKLQAPRGTCAKLPLWRPLVLLLSEWLLLRLHQTDADAAPQGDSTTLGLSAYSHESSQRECNRRKGRLDTRLLLLWLLLLPPPPPLLEVGEGEGEDDDALTQERRRQLPGAVNLVWKG